MAHERRLRSIVGERRFDRDDRASVLPVRVDIRTRPERLERACHQKRHTEDVALSCRDLLDASRVVREKRRLEQHEARGGGAEAHLLADEDSLRRAEVDVTVLLEARGEDRFFRERVVSRHDARHPGEVRVSGTTRLLLLLLLLLSDHALSELRNLVRGHPGERVCRRSLRRRLRCIRRFTRSRRRLAHMCRLPGDSLEVFSSRRKSLTAPRLPSQRGARAGPPAQPTSPPQTGGCIPPRHGRTVRSRGQG